MKGEPLQPDIDLVVERGAIPQYKLISDGWYCRNDTDGQQVMFSQENAKLFAIQYGQNDRSAKIIVEKPTKKVMQLGIQFGFLLAAHQKYVGVHGVTLLCANEIVILSAPSGTGKTTLAQLLETYCDAVVINGDFALLNPTEDGVVFEPTPFCGSTTRSLNHRLRVNRIVFLGQAKENAWRELDGREAMKRFMSNAFIPEWNNGIQKTVQENILRCITALKISAYDFAPTQKAAEIFLKHMENESNCSVRSE